VRLEENLRVLVDWWSKFFQTVFLLEILNFLHGVVAFSEGYLVAHSFAADAQVVCRKMSLADLLGPHLVVIRRQRPLAARASPIFCEVLQLLNAVPLAIAPHELVGLVFMAQDRPRFVLCDGLYSTFFESSGAHEVACRLGHREGLGSQD
jgi:hypothetical protein